MEDLKLHPLLTDRARLLIMATLAASKQSADFGTLLTTLGLSKGNLSSHLRRLETSGFIQVKKEFVDRKPRTTLRCTALGRKEIKAYLETVEEFLKAVS